MWFPKGNRVSKRDALRIGFTDRLPPWAPLHTRTSTKRRGRDLNPRDLSAYPLSKRAGIAGLPNLSVTVDRGRIELPTPRASTECSTSELPVHQVGRVGFEPTTARGTVGFTVRWGSPSPQPAQKQKQCGRWGSNPHRISPSGLSDQRGCQLRHDRIEKECAAC